MDQIRRVAVGRQGRRRHKTGRVADGVIKPAAAETDTRIIRTVAGTGRLLDPAGLVEVDTVLGLPGMSHFTIKADERIDEDRAPCGLALASAGIAFCYMTQMSRYIEHMKFAIDGVRLVQYSPYATTHVVGRLDGRIEPVDTHLFLNGSEDDETFEQLMHIAARTCYLHATLIAELEPLINVHHDPA